MIEEKPKVKKHHTLQEIIRMLDRALANKTDTTESEAAIQSANH